MATLATSGMASTLNVPAHDDTMEISSDAGRADQDVEIDFMDSEHGDEDVDWMLQDAAPERGNPQAQVDHSHNDDFMYDEVEEITYVEEETMQDDGHDYSEAQDEAVDVDFEFDPHPATEETLYDATQNAELEQEQGYEQPEEETLIDFETFSEHGEEQAVDQQAQQTEEDAVTYDDTSFEEQEQPAALDALEAPSDAVSYEAGASWDDAGAPAANAELIADDLAPAHTDDVAGTELLASEQPSELEATSLYEPPAQEGPTATADAVQQDQSFIADAASVIAAEPSLSTSVKATVHPITVFYAFEGFEYSLFPQSEHDDPNTYLLKDTSVASSTLRDLFRACRSVLDQQVSDDVELEFYIDSLHLTISEDSIHCRESSLAQIVDVYVDLVRNEGVDVIPALYMELNTKDRFSAQLTSLFKAASEKRGLYSLSIYQDEQRPESEGAEIEDQEQEQQEQQEPKQEEEDDRGTALEEPVPETQADDADYAQADAKTEAVQETVPTTAEVDYEETGITAEEPAEQIQSNVEDRFAAFEDSTAQPQDGFAEETIGHQDTSLEEQDTSQNEQGQNNGQPDVVDDAEQGDGSSSGSSTIQGENQPESTRGYSPSLEDEEWLIDYDDEDIDFDAQSDSAQEHDQLVAKGEEDAVAQEEQQAQLGDFDGQFDTAESYDFTEGQVEENYDDSAFATDTINQEFDDSIDYTVDQDYLEQNQDESGQGEEQHEWRQDDTHYEEDTTEPTHTSGTFQVPSSTEDDEDEITFNDDEFTFDDEPTQDATVQDTTTDSPLGKRGREDEDEGVIDGGDQESKRLKAS